MRTVSARANLIRIAVLAAALAGVAVVPVTRGSRGSEPAPTWSGVDLLVKNQKYEEASKQVAAILAAARARKDDADWTKALVRGAQLRLGLHGYESAVRSLKEEPWPQTPLAQTTLDLFYAQALVQYERMNSWEIGRREKVEAAGLVDLRMWTRAQILEEAEKAYLRAWERRAALGKLPAGALGEYIEPGDYPADVRGTLRDGVSYLFAELLADSSLWTPEQSSDVYRLDLASLLAADGRGADGILADRAAHPIAKLVAVLADLETWHGGAGERAAELEARLERLRRLHGAFTEEADRAAIERDLVARLPRYRDVSWWAMGMAELASFRQDGDTPGNLIRARETALEALGAYPLSPGGRRAAATVAAIEAPGYEATSMSSDAPDRRSIRITHKNLGALYFRAYRVDLVARIVATRDASLVPGRADVRSLLERGHPAAEWDVPLPPTPDFKQHSTYVTPPMREPGAYEVVVSARRDFGEKQNRMKAVTLVLTDLVLVTHSESSAIVARVVSGSTGLPVAGADVALWVAEWSLRGSHRSASATTDGQGLVRFAWAAGMEGQRNFLVATKDGQVALDLRYAALSPPVEQSEDVRSLVYTDRAIYRPAQKVLWKVVAYRGRSGGGNFRAAAETMATVTLEDSNREVVESKLVTTNAYGSAAGEFVIPPGRALGAWAVRSNLVGEASIQVEEYKRPTFEVKWEDPKQALRLNQAAKLTGSARYYFGLPVTSGSAHWTVRRVPQFPWWWWRWGPRVDSSQRVVAQGTSVLTAEGTFEASFTPTADERLASSAKDLTYQFEVEASVTDEGGETRSEGRTFRLGFVAVEAEIRLDTGFVLEGAGASLALLRTDLDGAPRSGAGRWHLCSIVQPDRTLLPADMSPDEPPADAFATPGDRLRPRWDTNLSLEATLRGWPDGLERARGEVSHDAKGKAELRLPALPAGAWRLRYETRDAFGTAYETSRDFLVAGPKTRIAFPEVLLTESESVRAGGTARFLVASGLANQTLFLDVLRGGQVVSRRQVASSDGGLVEIPVTAEDRGGFSVRVSLVRDHQFLTQGTAVLVPWDDKELAVSFETFRDRIRPGGKETWRIRVKAPPGTPSEFRGAELLASMYDRSLDAFVEPNPPSVASLYPDHRQDPGLFATVSPTGWQHIGGEDFGAAAPPVSLRGDRLMFFDGYAIGGPGQRLMLMKSMATAESRAPASAPVEGGVMGGLVADAIQPAREEVTVAAMASKNVHVQGSGESSALRSDFSETAFWKPQLLTDSDGSAMIEFQVPDSVTSWNVWVHAVTRDLKGGSVHRETQSVKDLMVRPYVPRFLREGDAASLKVVVNNASAQPLAGTVTLDIVDTQTNQSALAEFGLTREAASQAITVAAGAGANAAFALAAPRRVGTYAFKATATAGDFSDGELRPVPVLPGRMQLAQSRFAALSGGQRRTLTFADMAKADDPTRIDEQLVVTVDAQLFYSVLNALPYLVNYPYECVEQTLNRFVSTGMVSSLFHDYPAVAKMAEELSKRETPLETWTAPDPTRRMALEETPWLEEAKGGKDAGHGLVKVLDPRIAKAERETSLAKLRNSQAASGAFPWWPGGPPSEYMTLYTMYGFAKAAEFGVDVPRDMVEHGWDYLARRFRDEYAKRMADDKCSPEWLTFLAYTATCYPDPSWMGAALTPAERAAILAFSFKHWRDQSPYLKGLLALTLKRSGRPKDATLVWSSVMDSAKTERDLGTYWAPEDRAWLWYEDTIETQAFALRTLMELDPHDERRHGLVQWLFLNKKLNQWQSTRATAEVLYALVWYLKGEGALAVDETLEVRTGDQATTFAFTPDRYTGKRNQVVVPGEKLDPRRDSDISVSKTGKGLAFASATWNFSTEKLPEEDRGGFFAVSRKYFKREAAASGMVLKPLSEGATLAQGDEVEVKLSVRAKHAAEYVHLRDPRAAGLEPGIAVSGYKWDLGIGWYEETRDSGTDFFFEWLPAGQYTLKYRVRANMAGTFRVGPATIQSLYAPEFAAYSAGATLAIR
jgi:uncharacterized protein YfaS (alpha-2-macroglobulin family)